MPFYEYVCPQHGKFEVLKPMSERATNNCPQCNRMCTLAMSRFSHYWFNPFFVDGKGFTSKYMRPEEKAELSQECRER